MTLYFFNQLICINCTTVKGVAKCISLKYIPDHRSDNTWSHPSRVTTPRIVFLHPIFLSISYRLKCLNLEQTSKKHEKKMEISSGTVILIFPENKNHLKNRKKIELHHHF